MLTLLALALPGDLTAISRPVMNDLMILGIDRGGTSALHNVRIPVCRSRCCLFRCAICRSRLPHLSRFSVVGEVMSTSELVGSVVVIGSCLFIARREFIRARRPSSNGRSGGLIASHLLPAGVGLVKPTAGIHHLGRENSCQQLCFA